MRSIHEKQDDGTVVMVEVIRNTNKTLSIKIMWKKSPDKHHANNSLLDTSEAAVGSTSSTNGNVTQNPISVNDKTPKYSIRKTQDKTPLTPKRKKKRTTQEIYTKSGK